MPHEVKPTPVRHPGMRMRNRASQETALILGANSAIAQATAYRLASEGYALILAARNVAALATLAAGLRGVGACVLATHVIDFLDADAGTALFDELRRAAIPVDLVLVCYGVMHDNASCIARRERWSEMVATNFTSTAWCLEQACNLLEREHGGELIVISSVSGDRGRARNYCYGSTKAALDAFVEGMRMARRGSRINIMLVKPGPVATPMSGGNTRRFLQSSPDAVATVIVDAVGRGRSIVYAPRWWRVVMGMVRRMPAALLARLAI